MRMPDSWFALTPALHVLLRELGFTTSTKRIGDFIYDDEWKLELWIRPAHNQYHPVEETLFGVLHLPAGGVTGNLSISIDRALDCECLSMILRWYAFPVDKILRHRRLNALIA